MNSGSLARSNAVARLSSSARRALLILLQDQKVPARHLQTSLPPLKAWRESAGGTTVGAASIGSAPSAAQTKQHVRAHERSKNSKSLSRERRETKDVRLVQNNHHSL